MRRRASTGSAAFAGLAANRLYALLLSKPECPMTDEDYNRLIAKQVAHERILGFLLTPHLKGLSTAQLQVLEGVLSQPAGLPDFGPDIDIGTADSVAGLAMDYADAIQRVFRLALAGAAERRAEQAK